MAAQQVRLIPVRLLCICAIAVQHPVLFRRLASADFFLMTHCCVLHNNGLRSLVHAWHASC